MSEFIKRIVTEKQELDEKRAKLSAFLTSDKIHELPKADANLLSIQYSVMQTYSDILESRLELLDPVE